MTRFIETAQKTISAAEKQDNGWIVKFVDGSCRLIKKSEIRGWAAVVPGKTVESCRTRCNGADKDGNCTLQFVGRPRLDGKKSPAVKCNEQYVFINKPRHFGETKPKFNRCAQKMSYLIKSYKTIKGRTSIVPDQWEITFENGETRRILKSDIIGRKMPQKGHYLAPCSEECPHRGGECVYCRGNRSGTPCEQSFYFCLKHLKRHTNDRSK